MTDSNLQNTVPEGAFGIGSKKTDDFTKNEKLRNTGIKDVPKMILDSLKNQTGATVLPQQITEKAIEKATIDGEDVETAAKIAIGAATGVPAFVNGIADTGKGIYDYTRGKPYTETNIFDISSIEEQYAGDTAYELPKVFVQFLIPFGAIGKGSKAIGITSNLVKAKKAKVAFNVLQNPIQAGVAETLAFKPTENNFYNLFDPLVAKFPNLSNPIYEYLRADEQTEDFNFADRKLRQFLGATLNPVDVALTGKELTTGIKTLKTSDKIISNLKSQLDAVKADKELKDTIVNQLDKRDGFELQKTLPSNADDLDVTTIKKVNNIKGDKFDNAFEKYDKLTPSELEDRISDNLGLRRKVKPFKTNLEAGRGLKGSQGADELKKRLQLETNFKRANPEEVKSVQEFIDIIGDDMFDDVSLSLSNKIGAAGQFDFASSLITIRRKVVEGFEQGTGGGLDHVAVHELWHSLSRYLPKEDLIRYKKEFTNAQTKYLKQFDKERSKFIRTTSKEELANLIFQTSDDPFARKPNITDKNFLRKANAYFERSKFTNENYRFKNIDEFFAENLADEFFNAIEAGGRLDLAPTGTFKRISQEVSIFLQDLYQNLKARLGGSNTKKIFGDFVKRKNVKKYRRFALDETSVDRVVEAPKRKKFNNRPGGDPEITPNQINPEQVANSQRNAEFTFSRARVIKEEGTYSAVKSRQDTVAGAIKLLADTPKLREYAKAYAAMYNEVPTDELTYALAEKITYATQQIAETNQKLINSIQVIKDPKIIEQDVLEITDNLLELDDWLRLGIPLRTEPARALSAMQIPTTGLSPQQLANLSPAERFKMTRLNQTDIVMSSDDLQLRGEQLRELLLRNLEEGKATGDFSKLNKLTNVIKRTEGKVEKLENLYKTGLMHRILDKVDPAVRLFNEIRINAMLSGPGTQEINLISGVLETFQSSFELALGATNKAEFDAAMAHLTGLVSDFNFSAKAWKQSWNLEDNFVNPGSLKTDYSDRFAVSMEGDSTTAKWVNRAGKGIRIPSRLMTANDALIQSRNIIGAAHYEAFMEASKRGLKGQSRTDFIKENVDAVIETFSTGSTKGLTKTQANILKYAKEFGRRSTYTEDIRTDGLMIGKTAKVLNGFANQVPIARTYMSFVRTPNNIFKRQARRTPLLNNLMGELANDLNSLDPIVRQQARGQLRFSKGAGLIFLGLAYNKLNEDADVHLTGGGPNLFTPDGRVEFKKKWDNKWRPYSIGYAKKDADGNYIYGEDGKKMFDYYSYQRLDPLSGWIGLMTDFSRITGYLTQGETDEFITKYLYAFSRNIFDRSYLSDLRDFAIFSSDPARGRSHFADILTGVVPNLVVQGNRLPGDIADMMGVPKEESEILDVRPDTKVRAGDELFGIKARDNQLIKELREMLNKYSEKVPGYSMNLPPSRQHITDDFKTFPEKVGPDLVSWIGKSETKNYKILTVLADLGKTLPEPSDVIVGSSKGSKIEPIPLNTNQYEEVQKIINNQKLIDGLTLKQALDKYMETDYFKRNYEIVKRVGRKDADIAISRIMNGKPGDKGVLGLGLRGINSFYIEKGQDLWIRQQGESLLKKQVEILKETKDNYRKEYDRTLSESDLTF